ncbi:MAG: hypothetical protein JSW27_22880 [Phycisphaerales bacterium]|nr:MAG: hypothetical protein JSW27_22880 [Phycisphaerales bacterium]
MAKKKTRAKTPEPPEAPKQRTCGTMPVHERLLRTNPAYLRGRVASENRHYEYLRRGPTVARTGITVIPVVVNVVYNTAAQNISKTQIRSQIDVLNADYRKTNADISSLPAVFQALATDARIEFVLASKDPDGNQTEGIRRKKTNVASFGDDDSVKSSASGGLDAWPADKYLNIWVCQLSGGLLGYAQFPGGPADTDGVVIRCTAFGTTGTAAAPFDLGRTTTHEIGHWLNLRHIWGDDGNGCSGSDFVNDTPNQGGPNYGTPAFPHVSCNNGPNGDLFMNYMDYVDDTAMFMFTSGQVDRMQACLDTDRSSIGTQKPGPTAKFIEDIPTLKFKEDWPPVTLKFRDDWPPSLKFSEDPQPSVKFTEDPQPTLKFSEDYQPTSKFRDDVKQPGLDKPPYQDFGKFPGSDWQGGQLPMGGRAAPFILSTPHHSMAWTRTFPEAAQASLQACAQQIQQYENQLNSYAQAEAAGQLSAADRQQADAMYQEYLALVQEYRQLAGR